MQRKFRVPDDIWDAFCASLPVDMTPSDALRDMVQHSLSSLDQGGQTALDQIMGTEEAAKRWELTQDHIKRLCRDGKVKCRLIGKTWVLEKDQPNPKQ